MPVAPDVARLERRLPPLLSAVASMVDVIGFVSLGKLFTAHVTGNLMVIAALLVRGGPPNLAQILAVPVFIIAVAAVGLIAKASDRRGPALARPLLLIHFLLLACALIFSVTHDPAANPHGLMAGVAAMIAVSAMACQFALLRLAVPGSASTAVMTGNVTAAVRSLLDTVSSGQPLMEETHERLQGPSSSSSASLQAALPAGQRSHCWATGPGHFPSCWPGWQWHCGRKGGPR
jgi:uncharacterized membrane protein YoaK (UPF0700 family)